MGSVKRWLGYGLLLLVLLFGVLFSIQNDGRVPLDLLIVQLPAQSIALWVLLAFAAGGLAGLLISSVALMRLKGQSARLRRRVNKQNQELDRLRTADLRAALPGAAGGKTTFDNPASDGHRKGS